MIDHLLKFADQPTAKGDSDMQDDLTAALWRFDMVLADVKVWRNSQDVAGTDAGGQPMVTHSYLAGFFVLVATETQIPKLVNHAAVQVVIDREKARTRTAGMIIKSTVGGVVLQDIRMSPIFAGADYPWGGLN